MSAGPPMNQIHFAYPTWPERTAPTGWLTRDPACQACWYYFTIAMRTRDAVGKSIDDQIIEYRVGAGIMDTPLWMDNRHHAQAKSVAFLYGLESPDEMWKFWPNVKMQARSDGYPEPHSDILNPKEDRIN